MAQDEQDDAARAFENLAAEVRVMRRAVEALEAKKHVDYAPTLAALTQELERLTSATAAMTRRPGVALTPEGYAAQMRRAAEEATQPAAAELQRVQTLTSALERALGGIRTREELGRWAFNCGKQWRRCGGRKHWRRGRTTGVGPCSAVNAPAT